VEAGDAIEGRLGCLGRIAVAIAEVAWVGFGSHLGWGLPTAIGPALLVLLFVGALVFRLLSRIFDLEDKEAKRAEENDVETWLAQHEGRLNEFDAWRDQFTAPQQESIQLPPPQNSASPEQPPSGREV
jgi:hypothetical protein